MIEDNAKSQPILAIIVPCFNEAECLPRTITVLSGILDTLMTTGMISPESYLFFVDDGSRDETWAMIAMNNRASDSRVRGSRLTRNFGHQNALLAGLLKVKDRCDLSISIDADLQQDPAAIMAFVDAYHSGAEVVLGVRKNRGSDNWLKKRTAQIFYGLMRVMGVPIVPNHADYRLMGKRAMAALAEYGESNLFLRYACTQLGFPTETVYFDVTARTQGASKYTVRKMLQLALQGITSSSVMPLRLVALTGLTVFALSFIMGCYVLYVALIARIALPGWASTTLPIYFIGGIQLLCLGVVGEYIGQILREVKKRPRFHSDSELF